jgi:hypothetical protein
LMEGSPNNASGAHGDTRDAKAAQLAALHRMDKIVVPKTPVPVGFGPSFMRALADPDTKTILMCGTGACKSRVALAFSEFVEGGGFDFCHSAILVPELKRLGKRIVWLSYSFGLISNVTAETVFSCSEDKGPIVKLVSASSGGPPNYQPEIGFCKSLDAAFPADAPHTMYACYARDFAITTLSQVYRHIVAAHDVDTLLMIDGGSDSLMRGDESGLGDPVEDAVSVGAGASLRTLRHKFLLSVGFGADRFNGVSDGASLRAVAELTKLGGFRGSVSVEPDDPGFAFYRATLETIYALQTFRSVLSSLILAAGEGEYGMVVPKHSGGRVREGSAYVWPLMNMLWAFDVDAVAARSWIVGWIREAKSQDESQMMLMIERRKIKIRDEE